jgi:hypothetical protein
MARTRHSFPRDILYNRARRIEGQPSSLFLMKKVKFNPNLGINIKNSERLKTVIHIILLYQHGFTFSKMRCWHGILLQKLNLKKSFRLFSDQDKKCGGSDSLNRKKLSEILIQQKYSDPKSKRLFSKKKSVIRTLHACLVTGVWGPIPGILQGQRVLHRVAHLQAHLLRREF